MQLRLNILSQRNWGQKICSKEKPQLFLPNTGTTPLRKKVYMVL